MGRFSGLSGEDNIDNNENDDDNDDDDNDNDDDNNNDGKDIEKVEAKVVLTSGRSRAGGRRVARGICSKPCPPAADKDGGDGGAADDDKEDNKDSLVGGSVENDSD